MAQDLPSSEHSTSTSKRQVSDLVQRIKQSADKLARDGSTRGDLKILSRAMRELAYAFKVFAPYRQHRKVTMFDSARWMRPWKF